MKIGISVLGLLLLAAGGIFAAKALRPDRHEGDNAKAGTADPKPGVPVPITPVKPPAPTTHPPLPAVTPPAVTPPSVTPTAPEPAPPLPASLSQLVATYRKEIVRVNHPRNCVLCHTPSFQQTDLIRGAVPDPRQPLPPPTTPAYYAAGGQFVSADTTYLRQDFSVVQPVPDAGNWSSHQRYDYFVSVRKVEGEPAAAPGADSPYRRAAAFAIRELSGRDPERDVEWMTEQRRTAGPPADDRLTEVAQAVSLQADPAALLSLKSREFAEPLLRLGNEDLGKYVKGLQETHGETATRTALIAYLRPLTKSGDDSARAKAARLLAAALDPAADADLPARLIAAAGAASVPPRLVAARAARPTASPKTDRGLDGTGKDGRGFATFSITKRLDTRKTEELEKELLAVREVRLTDPAGGRGAAELITLAERRKRDSQPYPGSAVACDGRADLAGLPFRLGLDATLGREKAQAMNGLSRQLRESMQRCIRNPNDPRPDTDLLHKMLTSEAGRGRGFYLAGEKTWATAEAVPCIQQMLQAEDRDVRRMSLELLARVEAPDAAEALVQWAVFDTEPANRAAAVAFLRSRDRVQVSRLLSRYVRYPWPRAAEHAAEALVALDCTEVIPELAAAYQQPDPDAPFRVLAGGLVAESAPGPKSEPTNPAADIAILHALRAAEASATAARVTARAELEGRVTASKGADPAGRQKAAADLAPFLSDPDVLLRRKAAIALADLGADAAPAEAALREAANDTDVEVRTAAGQAVDKLTEVALAKKKAEIQAAVTALAKDLKAKEPEDRVKALLKIASHGADADSVSESVIEAMRDNAGAVRTAAADALRQINPKVHPHVVALLHGPAKREAITALGDLGGDARVALPLLLYCNDHPLFWGGGTARAGKYEDLFPVIAKIAPTDKRFAAAVLGCVSAPNPREDRTLRERRLAALGQMKVIEAEPKDKVGALVAALGDRQALVEVIKALEDFGPDAEPALPVLRKLKTSTIDTVRNAAITAIAKIESAKK